MKTLLKNVRLNGEKTSILIENSKFANNTAEKNGGAVDNGGETTITNSQFANNNAEYGGAINNDESL